MVETKMVIIPVSELKYHLLEILQEAENRKQRLYEEKKQSEMLYTRNEVAKRLRRAHSTITKLIEQGILKATSDGLISEKAINDYLSNT
jgi:hypothetical protein